MIKLNRSFCLLCILLLILSRIYNIDALSGQGLYTVCIRQHAGVYSIYEGGVCEWEGVGGGGSVSDNTVGMCEAGSKLIIIIHLATRCRLLCRE